LAHKYRNELHANEVVILPYYVANLNIEATYAAITGQYAEFPNLCFVDTLDNVTALGIRSGHQHDLFGAMSDENIERIRRQNRRKISVIIGNPPYNANQQNENENNKNRTYKQIDQTIKSTYIAQSTAQKTKVYDMYARFFRWASDRLHDDGVIAFITNRSFIDSRTFDGFRKVVAKEFAEIRVVDLGGDVRANPKLSGTTHNVFGIQTGVAISFFVKKKGKADAVIRYARRPEMERADDKLAFLAGAHLSSLATETIIPSKRHYWINQIENDWDDLVPLCSKNAKAGKRGHHAVFKLFSRGVGTFRDEWVYDFSHEGLEAKARYLVETYENSRRDPDYADRNMIKWDRELEKYRANGIAKTFSTDSIITANYRSFCKKWMYRDRHLNGMNYQIPLIFGDGKTENPSVVFMGDSTGRPYYILALDRIPDLNFVSPASGGTQILPRYRYTASGERVDNITDWGLRQFEAHYGKNKDRPITRDAIFHYCYGVLHDPVYRETYAINLKREFPRIPFYPDFWQWAAWGERLMDLHITYETVEPWPLQRTDTPDDKAREAGVAPTPKLKADKDNGIIVLDSETQLSGIPPAVWDYRLGNRSGLEWILDQYKEKKP
ncbi:MAG: type ISP restriction/modification enzyme, partial [Phycisphaerales bacterium]